MKSKLAASDNTVVLLKDFDEKRSDLTLSDASTSEDITAFSSAQGVPLIQVFSPESSEKIFKSSIQVHSLFFTNTASDHHAPTMAAFTESAKDNRGKSLFINVPSSEARVMEYFGFKEADLPAYVLADMRGNGMKKYFFSGKFEKSAVNDFVSSFFAGTLSATLKSEEPSPEDTTGPVVVLKGKSFKELVLDNDKDVLVEVHFTDIYYTYNNY